MSALVQQLSHYAAYHRDRRNIAAHMVGIPLIVFAVAVLLSRPAGGVAGVPVTPAIAASILAAVYYFTLDTGFALLLALLMGLACWAGLVLARLPTAQWAAVGIGCFVLGWIIQFIGHAFEGRKPAFLDDLVSLLIGPLFVAAECSFLLGLRRDVEAAIGRALAIPPPIC